jgi:hypothetical protein
MSSPGQIVGGIVGAVIGFVGTGFNPAGALYGASVGMAIGGALDPPKGPTIEGPRLNDLTIQSSTYGQFIPRTYGTIGLSGNVFWLENNKIKEVVKKKKSGGKGGGSSTVTKTYSYFATFAVGLCEGPISGVRRIWVGPDLIYDSGSDDIGTIIASNGASSKFTVYTGTDTQQPDPRIQAEMGVANCPAYRGLAYLVMKDFALAKYGNSVSGAQVKVEVVQSSSSSFGGLFSSLPISSAARSYKSAAPYMSGGILSIYTSSTSWVGGVGGLASAIAYSAPDNSIRSISGGFPEASAQEYMPAWSTTDEIIQRGNIGDGGSGNSGSLYSNGVKFAASSMLKSVGNGQGITRYCRRGKLRLVLATAISGQVNTSIVSDVSLGYDQNIIISTPADPDGQMADIFIGESYNYALTLSKNVVCYDRNWTKLWSTNVSGIGSLSIGDTDSAVIREASSGIVVVRKKSVFYRVTEGGYTTLGSVSEAMEASGVLGADHLAWPIWTRLDSTNGNVFNILLENIAIIDPSLSYIVATEAARSALIKPADINTSGLADAVKGFKVTATGSIRNAIEPLRGAWPFDVVQSGYQIKATSRGSASVVTIPVGELAIDTQLTESREMDSQLPQNVTVKYIDQVRDYDVNEQRAQRDNTEAVNSLVIDLPVVLSATQGAQVAEKLIRIYSLERSDFSFTLPAPYRYLEPGDVITIATSEADFLLRLVSVNHAADGRLECSARPSNASTYASIAPGAQGQIGATTIPLDGPTVSTLIDCPVIDDGLQDSPGFVCSFNGYSNGWPGGILYQTADESQTWTDLQAIQGQSTSGLASGALLVSAGNLVQVGGSLTVALVAGTLESVTEAQMFNGANFAVYGKPGRWEIIRFQNATLVSAGVYTLDTFWRGDKGTEWATGLHVAGDQFILMTDPDLAFVGMPTDTIGQPRNYRAVTAGADIDSAADQAFTYFGVNLETYSGVHPKGARAASDLTVSWQRRTRVGGAWRDSVDASLGETLQAYEVDIMQGAVVKRTLASSTQSVLYTSAQQITDFGSNQASVSVNIYQLSSVVGRGYPLGATL